VRYHGRVPVHRLFAVFSLFLLLSSCNIVEHTKQCVALAKTLERASSGLAEPRIDKNPKPKLLRDKAQRYIALAGELEGLSLAKGKLETEVATLRALLTQVGNHLNEAALAVDKELSDEKTTKPAAPISDSANIPPNGHDRRRPQQAARLREPLGRYESLKRSIDTASTGINASISRLTIECR
jgi:hypothetical protein